METFDARLTAVVLDSNVGPILLVCVYMPCDIGDTECYHNFTDICCKINTLYSDADAEHAIVAGDLTVNQVLVFSMSLWAVQMIISLFWLI